MLRRVLGGGLRPEVWLLVLVGAYVLLGSLYALRTPLWQNPDEPAHYNYLRQLSTGGGVPVLQAGDYQQAAIERLMEARFPPSMAVDSLRYEGHQPPLYYVLGAAVDWTLSGADLAIRGRALRLFGVLLGAGIVLAAYRAGRLLFPSQPPLALGVAAVPALLPQHVAMTAAINNDALGWLLCALVLWAALHMVQRPLSLTSLRSQVLLGGLMGAVLLTKTTAFACLALPAMAALAPRLAGVRPESRAVRGFVVAYTIALAIGCAWFLRNVSVYGGVDFLGLTRHNDIVTGQPLAQGWDLGNVRSLVTTLFQSAWVQLGWMAVPAQPWVYALLAAVTGVLAGGAALAIRRGAWAGSVGRMHLALLVTPACLALLQVAYYNLQFLQPQGRYLFTALIPAGALVMAGVPLWTGARWAPWLVLVLCLGLAGLNVHALTVLIPFLEPLQ